MKIIEVKQIPNGPHYAIIVIKEVNDWDGGEGIRVLNVIEYTSYANNEAGLKAFERAILSYDSKGVAYKAMYVEATFEVEKTIKEIK